MGWHTEVHIDAIGRPLRVMVSVRLRPKTRASERAFQQDMLDAPELLAVWTAEQLMPAGNGPDARRAPPGTTRRSSL